MIKFILKLIYKISEKKYFNLMYEILNTNAEIIRKK